MTTCVTYPRLEKAGRLGNQLFQIAATVGIANATGARPSLPATWSYRKWFSCPPIWFARPRGEVLNAEAWEGLAHIDPRARMYLQDLGLFRDVADEIRAAFKPSVAAQGHLGWNARWDDAVVLHVRRGDLLTQTQGFQPALTEDFPAYYADALHSFDRWEERPVVVFSDDPDWCETNMPRILWCPVEVVRTNPPRPVGGDYRRAPATDWVDLQLMTQAPNLIMSNSTYAVWAAWLGNAERVVYPSTWFGPHLAHVDWKLMIDPTWEEIPCADPAA